jgi:hypothetical protein
MTEEVPADLSLEELADLLLLKDSVAHDQPLWLYLRNAGIVGEAARRRTRRHESNNMNGVLYPEAMDESGEG